MVGKELDQGSLAIGELRGQYSGLENQMNTLDGKIDTHLEHVRQSLHDIRNSLNKIDGRLYLGEQRMNKMDENITLAATIAKSNAEILARHMEEEEIAFKRMIDLTENHERRLTALDHPDEGKVPQIEEITQGIKAVHTTGKIVAGAATMVAAVGGAWAAIKHWGA